MGGVDVGGGGGGKRKSLDSEINMIPFIDLLMVTISFLLITAVWTHMARINADAQVPGPPRPDVEQEKIEPEKQLHVEMRERGQVRPRLEAGEHRRRHDRRAPQGRRSPRKAPSRSSASPTSPRRSRASGRPRASTRDPTDKKFDQAILHTDNKTRVHATSSASSTRSTRRSATVQHRRQDREGPGLQRHLRGQLRSMAMTSRTSPAGG